MNRYRYLNGMKLMENGSIVVKCLEIWLINLTLGSMYRCPIYSFIHNAPQEADFIVIVCSLGARLRCSKKRVRFREATGRFLPDYFAVAVDYVAEKLRVERSKGEVMIF